MVIRFWILLLRFTQRQNDKQNILISTQMLIRQPTHLNESRRVVAISYVHISNLLPISIVLQWRSLYSKTLTVSEIL